MFNLEVISDRSHFTAVTAFTPFEYVTRGNDLGSVVAHFCGEAHDIRTCSITGEKAKTRSAYFTVKNVGGEVVRYRHRDPVTLAEFRAMCARIIPGFNNCTRHSNPHQ